MECNKLGKKIHDWATKLGFMLTDGSTPPLSYFALLTATPHRRQLWETLIDSVQSRQKVEHIRKQILVAKILQRKKYVKSTTPKQQKDRLDLWQEQGKLEAEVKDKENAVIKLEKNITTRASDALFEMCKLLEHEKQLEELNEKSLIMKVLIKRKKKVKEDFESHILKVKKISDLPNNLDKSVEKVISFWSERELLGLPECECSPVDSNNCILCIKIKDLCECGVTEQSFWVEVIKCKRILLEKFLLFLDYLNSNEKSLLWERKLEVEKSLSLSTGNLKQKGTEKSLQILINSTEGKLLESEVEALEDKILDELFQKSSEDLNLNETIPFLSSDEMRKSDVENERNFKNYLNTIELNEYLEFLKEELNRLEESVRVKEKKGREDTKAGTEELHETLKTFESIANDINSFRLEGENIEKEIFGFYGKLQSLRDPLEVEMNGTTEGRAANRVADKLKFESEKQISLLLQTPLDAFTTVKSSSGRILFERESPSHCLKNNGGELKQFFSAMLIPPLTELKDVLLEVVKRKKAVNELKTFLSDRENLSEVQKKIKNELSGIKYETKLCEENFRKSDKILWNVLHKTDKLMVEVDFIEKILKNWVEQPYELMIKETNDGKNLREYEEKQRKK